MINWLRKLFRLSPDPLDEFWYSRAPIRTASGIKIADDAAMTYSACWAATRLLASTGGCLPLNLMRRSGSRTEVADNTRIHRLIHHQPNPEMSTGTFRALGIDWQVNRGNFHAEIERDSVGRPLWLWPIHYTRISPGRADADAARRLSVPGNSIVWQVSNNQGPPDLIPDRDMLHIKSTLTQNGIVGKGVVQHAMETIGFGLATERQGAAYMANSARPLVVIKGGRFRNIEEREEYRRTWVELHGGPENNARPAMLPAGAEIDKLTYTPEESQFLATRQHNVEEIARWYGVPPHMIGHLLRSTNNNIEMQSIEFVIYSLIPWLKIWEEEIWRKLLNPAQQQTHFAKHNVDGLLRGNSEARAKFYQAMWQLGALSINEIRSKEDLNPIEDGDEHFVPMNFQPLGTEPEPESEDEPIDSDAIADQVATRLRHERQEIMQGLLQGTRTKNGHPVCAETKPADDRIRYREASLKNLRETMWRLLAKESRAASQAAKSGPRPFFEWLDSYYDDRHVTLSRVLESAVSLVLVADGQPEYGEAYEATQRLAEWMASESREQLLAATECQPDEFEISVQNCLIGWVSRLEDPALETIICPKQNG